MPFTLIQTGNQLKTVNTDGGLSAPLTLPAGVTLATNLQPRFARFKQYVVVVNTPTRPISVGPDGTVRVLTPLPPTTPVILSAGAAGTLTGTYLALETFKILDTFGNVIAESDYGPAMQTAFTVTNQKLHASFQLSVDPGVNAIQLYRTATNGTVYFTWVKVDGNTVSSTENDIPDSALGIVAQAPLGTAPDLTLVAEFNGRLWGVSRQDIDSLRYTEAGTMYAWSGLNTLQIPHVGSDGAGITALIPRRAALGVARRDVFNQVTGSIRANITPTIVNGGEQVGVLSQESVQVFNDIAYFLYRDGVYKWDSNGIKCLTNGMVRSWFTTDSYFNRSMFWRAFSVLDPIAMRYRLFLASRGSSVIDRWIEYDILNGSWWGPHVTDAFNPTSAFLVAGRNQHLFPMIGSQEGILSQDQEARNDWGVMGIRMSARTINHEGLRPDTEKFWGEVSVFGHAQPAGTLIITPTIGELETAVTIVPFNADLTKTRNRLPRVGVGKSMSLQFDNNVINQDVALYGYEVNPVNIVGRR